MWPNPFYDKLYAKVFLWSKASQKLATLICAISANLGDEIYQNFSFQTLQNVPKLAFLV
jgi:hypothetical protein